MASTRLSNEEFTQRSVSEFNKEENKKLKTVLGPLKRPSSAGTCSSVILGVSSSTCFCYCLEKKYFSNDMGNCFWSH